jgi:hypothetical protein
MLTLHCSAPLNIDTSRYPDGGCNNDAEGDPNSE